MHAPFRQSKLTRVLRDCFIGNGRTVLIATVSPTDDCVACSLNTLQYANRVRQMALRHRKSKERKPITRIISKQAVEPPKPTRSITSSSSKVIIPNDIPNKSRPISTNMVLASMNPTSSMTSLTKTSSILPAKKFQPTSSVTSSQKPTEDENKLANPLFHPSKINMSSTPIKLSIKPINNSIILADELPFEHDTPIKGHKIKYIQKGTNMIAQLAERYFAKVNVPELNVDNQKQQPSLSFYVPNNDDQEQLNSKIYFKTEKDMINAKNEQENEEKKKNEDEESGVESDELNKSNEIKKQINKLSQPLASKTETETVYRAKETVLKKSEQVEKFKQRYKSIYSYESPPRSDLNTEKPAQRSPEKPSNTSLIDESLNRLRKKQKEMISRLTSSNKILNLDENIETSKIINGNYHDNDATSLLLNEEDLNTENILNGTSNNTQKEDSSTLVDKSGVFSSFKPTNSQKQLRMYIQNLETKLMNLRNEIKDNNNNTSTVVQSQSNSSPSKTNQKQINKISSDEMRLRSDSSCDSLKEIKMKQNENTSLFGSNNSVYNEFLQRRRILEKHQQKQQAKEEQYKVFRQQMFAELENVKLPDYDDDHHEKMFIEMQTKNDFMNNFENKTEQDYLKLSYSSSDDSDAVLKQSIHKGSKADILFSKSVRKPQSLMSSSSNSSSSSSGLLGNHMHFENGKEYKNQLVLDNLNNGTLLKTCDFSPIIQVDVLENNEEVNYPSQPEITPRTLLNPKPIRPNNTFESSLRSKQSNDNLLVKQVRNDIYEDFNSQSGVNLVRIQNNSKIWKMPATTIPTTQFKPSSNYRDNSWSNTFKDNNQPMEYSSSNAITTVPVSYSNNNETENKPKLYRTK